mgnify:CR=1 FL=1
MVYVRKRVYVLLIHACILVSHKKKTMRIALIILIGIHGIIHLFGFFKAFGIFEFNAISQPISKTSGIIWLLTFGLLITTIVLLIVQSKYWWFTGIIAVILSQILIINFWSDAKFGTILNLLILLSTIIGYSTFSFKNTIRVERTKMFDNFKIINKNIHSEQMLSGLPIIVQKWLHNSGAIGIKPIYTVYLEQELQMLMNPEQKDWMNAQATQYFTTEPPAFNWSVNLKMNSFLDVVGRDKFENGKGEMTIKLFSLFSIANAKNNDKVNQAALQRFLAETCWFPSATLSSYIKWEYIDDYSAKANIEYNRTKGSGIFHFDENGNFKKFVAMRFKDAMDAEPTEWTVTAIKNEIRNGIMVPIECEVNWKLKDSNWTWLKLKITDIKYNIQKIQMAEVID